MLRQLVNLLVDNVYVLALIMCVFYLHPRPRANKHIIAL